MRINMPAVWKQSTGLKSRIGQKMLVEPFIESFRKFNSNNGFADTDSDVAQALSHFSYHISDGAEVLCDLQGGKVGSDYVLSDVMVCTEARRFGPADLGREGIETFMAAHKCGRFCNPRWKRWENAERHFAPTPHTTLCEAPDAGAGGGGGPGLEKRELFPSKIWFTLGTISDKLRPPFDLWNLEHVAVLLAKQEISARRFPLMWVAWKKSTIFLRQYEQEGQKSSENRPRHPPWWLVA